MIIGVYTCGILYIVIRGLRQYVSGGTYRAVSGGEDGAVLEEVDEEERALEHGALVAWLAHLTQHEAAGEEGGTVQRLRGGTRPCDAIEAWCAAGSGETGEIGRLYPYWACRGRA